MKRPLMFSVYHLTMLWPFKIILGEIRNGRVQWHLFRVRYKRRLTDTCTRAGNVFQQSNAADSFASETGEPIRRPPVSRHLIGAFSNRAPDRFLGCVSRRVPLFARCLDTPTGSFSAATWTLSGHKVTSYPIRRPCK